MSHPATPAVFIPSQEVLEPGTLAGSTQVGDEAARGAAGGAPMPRPSTH